MKTSTQQWLEFGNADLVACEVSKNNEILSNIVLYHAQQAVEKCFKAIIEEKGVGMPRTHDLTRLHSLLKPHLKFEVDSTLLQTIDTIYTSSRYPGDLGLLPNGKPTVEDAIVFFEFAKDIFEKTKLLLGV
jgi:HEPN domain-containing protein